MENERVLIGVLILIGLVIGANLVMYAIVRGAARPGNKSFLETLGQSLKAPAPKKNDPIDELRRRVQELEEGEQEPGRDA